jgi:hypothetical protein
MLTLYRFYVYYYDAETPVAANKTTTTAATAITTNTVPMQAFQMTNMPGTVNSNLPMFLGGPSLHIMAGRGGSMASLAAANVIAAARHMGGMLPHGATAGQQQLHQPSPNPQQMLQMQQFAQAYQQHQHQVQQEGQAATVRDIAGGSMVKVEERRQGSEDELKAVGDSLGDDVQRERVNGLASGQVPLPTAMV